MMCLPDLFHETRGRGQTVRTIPAVAAIVALVLVAYLPALQAGYIWDDDAYLTANPHVQSPDGLVRIWVPGNTPQYYPLVFTGFWIEHALWGLEPVGYHLVNILLHAVNALLVWRVMRRLGLRGAWLIGAVFAVHPMEVESVAWITERKNVLSACFYLMAGLAYFRFEDHRRAGPGGPGGLGGPGGSGGPGEAGDGWGWYGAALLMYVAALLSKSVTCSLPAALILVMVYLRRPLSWRRLGPLVPMFAIGVLAAANTILMERLSVGASGPEWDHSIPDRVLIASRALLFYPAKLLWPHPLMFVYPRWTVDAGDVLSWWRSLVVLAVIAGISVAWVRGRRGPAVALAFYAGTVFPALGLINVYPHRFSFVADHFQYLAGRGLIALAVAGPVWLVPLRRGARTALATVGLVVLAVVSHRQARIYRDAETVWTDTLAKNPDSWMPHTHMAVIRLRQLGAIDRIAEPDRWMSVLAEARRHAERAVALKPDDPQVLGKLSEALRLEGRHDEAFEYQSEAVRLLEKRRAGQARWPGREAEEFVKLARLHLLRGERGRAETAYRRAVETAPGLLPARSELAGLLQEEGRVEEAVEQLRTLLSLQPQHFGALLAMGQLAEQRGDLAAARRSFDAASRVAVSALERIQAAIALVRFLATCAEATYRDVPLAVEIAENANVATGRRYPSLLDVLAEAYFAAGRTGEAIATAGEARDLARQVNAPDLAREIDGKLQRYRLGGGEGPD